MKYLGYVLRNTRRNPVRSLLTIASIGICLFLMMILVSFLAVNAEMAASRHGSNRLVSLNSQGFGGLLPIARVREIRAMDGIVAASPFCWYGGKFREQANLFAQFGVDPQQFNLIYEDLTVPPDQLEAWRKDRMGCLIGRKLAEDYKLKVGDPLPLKGDIYPIDLDLTVRAIYSGPSNQDQRMCLFDWEMFDEKLKKVARAETTGNAGTIFIKFKPGIEPATVCKRIDDLYKNTDTPTRTQTEEAFIRMFSEMAGDLRLYIIWVGAAVVFSLICVAGVSMAMSMRERTTEVAVLKAIGFGRGLVLALVLAEALLVAGLGGVAGALGAKAFFDAVDISKYTAGMLPFFYVPWSTALLGMGVSLLIGLTSGIVPALRASTMSVVNGLRKVV